MPSMDYDLTDVGEILHGSSSLELYMKEIRNIRFLSLDEELSLGEANCSSARNTLVYHNLRLAVSIAHKFSYFGVPLDDLINEGNLGLMHASTKYDPSRGLKFSTYAYPWVSTYISQYVYANKANIRVPSYVHQLAIQVRKFLKENLLTESAESISEACTKLGISYDASVKALEVVDLQAETSLDIPIPETEGLFFIDLVVSETDVEDSYLKKETREFVRSLLDGLGERHANVVRWRYGLDGQEPKTLQEIGDLLNVSKEYVRQLQEAAFKTLKLNLSFRHIGLNQLL